jgi:SAM-dependent methyltransferase
MDPLAYRPADRYSDKVESYVKHRPSYPAEVVDLVERACGPAPGGCLADLGSGTGIFTRLALDRGLRVYAVEANPEMRAAAEAWLGGDPRFVSVAGTAEATTLSDASVDAIVCAQAFHWFDPVRVVPEFDRILRPGGTIALVWNNRRLDADPFHVELEQVIAAGCPDYGGFQLADVELSEARLARMFPARRVVEYTFANHKVLDRGGLIGLVSSVSYCPPRGTATYERLVASLDALFERHQAGGRVRIEYQVQMFWLR